MQQIATDCSDCEKLIRRVLAGAGLRYTVRRDALAGLWVFHLSPTDQGPAERLLARRFIAGDLATNGRYDIYQCQRPSDDWLLRALGLDPSRCVAVKHARWWKGKRRLRRESKQRNTRSFATADRCPGKSQGQAKEFS